MSAPSINFLTRSRKTKLPRKVDFSRVYCNDLPEEKEPFLKNTLFSNACPSALSYKVTLTKRKKQWNVGEEKTFTRTNNFRHFLLSFRQTTIPPEKKIQAPQ